MKIEHQIAAAVAAALKELYGVEINAGEVTLEKTKKEFSKAESNEAATDAYYNLANLAKLKPDDKKLAKFIKG